MKHLDISEHAIKDFCRRWHIHELALFGSVLQDRYEPDSDVDVLVTFSPDTPWTLFDMVHMRDELKDIFGREVDLVSRRGIERSHNDLRRKAILSSGEAIYVQR